MSLEIIRDSQIAVSYTVRSGLNYVSQAQGENSPDALAERVLLLWLEEHHKPVMEHIYARKEQDKAFRAELKKKFNPDPFEPKPTE